MNVEVIALIVKPLNGLIDLMCSQIFCYTNLCQAVIENYHVLMPFCCMLGNIWNNKMGKYVQQRNNYLIAKKKKHDFLSQSLVFTASIYVFDRLAYILIYGAVCVVILCWLIC